MTSFQLTWTAADGTSTALNRANGLLVTKGPIGLDAPPTLNITTPYTGADGSSLFHRRRTERNIALPMLLEHPTRVATRVRQLAAMLQGPGTLTRTDDDGTVRQLRRVVYSGGLEGDLSNAASPTWRRVVVQLLALDPWWYGDTNTQNLAFGAATAFDAVVGFDAAIPFDGGTSTLVTVSGDGDAYPVFTVTGPATTLVVTDGVNAWQIAAALGAGQTLVVDSRPGSRGPRLGSGNVDWSLLTEASRLFELAASGTTSISVSASGTSGATSVTVAWEDRWLAP